MAPQTTKKARAGLTKRRRAGAVRRLIVKWWRAQGSRARQEVGEDRAGSRGGIAMSIPYLLKSSDIQAARPPDAKRHR
jgi:hypothetical protein